MPDDFAECPNCESTSLGVQLTTGRMVRQCCHDCYWEGEARVPKTKEILTKRRVPAGRFYGHEYEIFDHHGIIMVSSRTYATAEEAEEALKKDLATANKTLGAAPCTGVLWPAYVEVEGKVFR